MDVGQRIKDLRQSKGISREDLADLIEVSKFAIAKYEQGQREPKIEVLSKIADALGYTLSDIIKPQETLTNKLIKLFDANCGNLDAENTLEVLCELIDIDPPIITKALKTNTDLPEFYLIRIIEIVSRENPSMFSSFFYENKDLIMSSKYTNFIKTYNELLKVNESVQYRGHHIGGLVRLTPSLMHDIILSLASSNHFSYSIKDTDVETITDMTKEYIISLVKIVTEKNKNKDKG